MSLKQKGFGSAVWGDYDGDGDLDLLLNGDGGLASGEESSDIYRLYKNTNGAFAEATTFSTFRQISVGDGGKFADWDNDGDLDVIVTGWNGSRQATAIFLNNAGAFTPMANNDMLPGVSESSIEVADLDNDSDLDLLLTGFSGNNYNGANSAFNSFVSLAVMNPTTMVNLAPTMPTNLQVVAGTNGAVTFSWNAATDVTTPQQALSYNLFLVELNSGKHYSFAMADTTSGKLMLQRMGNVQLNKSWTINGLPNGRYRVGVQAIDNSFAGSPFMKTGFTLNNGVLTAISKDRPKFELNVYPNPSLGEVQVQLAAGKKYDVRVNTLDGRLVTSLSATGEAKVTLKAGMYVMQVRAANGDVETRRIVVQ